MAENDQAQEKTEEPTQRRLEKAREDGDVLSSKEMFVFASSIAGLFVLIIFNFSNLKPKAFPLTLSPLPTKACMPIMKKKHGNPKIAAAKRSNL